MAINEQVRFIAKDGTILDLTNYGVINLLARRNFDAPDTQLFTERLPNWPGSRLTGQSIQERQIQFSVEVMAGPWDDSRQKISDVINTLAQGGAINVIANGRERQIDVEFVGGLGNDTASRSGNVLTLVPEYRALWPYWYDVNQQIQPIDLSLSTTGTPVPTSLPIFFGLAGFSEQFTLIGGSVSSPWSVEIQGPLTRVQIARLDTNEVIDVAVGVNAGELLRVNTFPGRRRVQVDTSAGLKDVISGVTDQSVYWQIGPGVTACGISITGTSGRIATFRWYNYYRSSN